LLEESGVPSILFINKVDAAAERMSEIVSALQSFCSHSIVLRQVPLRDGDQVVGAIDLISERAWKYQEGEPSALIELPQEAEEREQEARTELLESLADFNDALLEQLIEDKRPATDEIYDVATSVLQHHDLVPALLGSALHSNGIMRLMKSLRHEAPRIDQTSERLQDLGSILAVGCLADMAKHLGKTVLIRAFADGLSGGSAIAGDTIGSLTDIDGKTAIPSLKAGEIALTVKTDHLNLGYGYSADANVTLPAWSVPRSAAYQRIITPTNERDETRLSNALSRLSEIEPGLSVAQDEQTGHARLTMQGPLHLRRLVGKLADSFGIQVDEAPVPPALRETISKKVEKHHRHRKQSGGAGQFADVLIDLKPEPRGSGFSFSDIVKGGAVPKNYIPSVEAGARDALLSGPNGFPVVDVSVLLKDGKHHAVDSSDYAFRTAGKNAVREAMEEAGAKVLQPIMSVKIHVPSVYSGGLVPIVSGMKGQVLGFETHPTAAGWDVFNALLPITAQDELFGALGGATRGTAWFEIEFDHYQEARREDLAALELA
jgi:elongation factor G